ncbi:uncharacterized protein LOC119445101 [Dermacentor silvarum]|uniref:uncharacterized protein LOC119445101 n=1 Tax=Dermacentor silvarum TaxID=543639 RepID=UPI0021019B78|nr:uncharacterized protein LOC119445101 [Dermacentor silvarum]
MTASFDCFFHLVHLLLIVAWAAYMYKDNYDGMAKSLVGISARVMGLGLCTTIDLGRTVIVKPPYLGSHFQRQIMHREKASHNIYEAEILRFLSISVTPMELVTGKVRHLRGTTSE